MEQVAYMGFHAMHSVGKWGADTGELQKAEEAEMVSSYRQVTLCHNVTWVCWKHCQTMTGIPRQTGNGISKNKAEKSYFWVTYWELQRDALISWGVLILGLRR